jgi:hypothetical protein
VVAFLLLIVSLLLAPLAILALTGHGSITFESRLQPPYRVTFDDGRSIKVGDAGTNVEYFNFPEGREGRSLADPLHVDTKITVGRDDTDTRVILVAAIGALLALSWFVLVSLRRIVQTARAGDPFDPRNANRLRWIAGLGLLAVVVVRVASAVVEHTLEADEPIHIRLAGPSWVLVLTGLLGLLALAEVFREGAELRELERATI